MVDLFRGCERLACLRQEFEHRARDSLWTGRKKPRCPLCEGPIRPFRATDWFGHQFASTADGTTKSYVMLYDLAKGEKKDPSRSHHAWRTWGM